MKNMYFGNTDNITTKTELMPDLSTNEFHQIHKKKALMKQINFNERINQNFQS